MVNFRTGDKVRITYAGRTVEGSVKLASRNGKSLMLEFDGMLGGFAGMMPVLHHADETFYDIITQQPAHLDLLKRVS